MPDVTQFRTGAKRTKTVRTDCEDARWSLEIGNNSTSTLNSNLLTIDDEFAPQSHKESIFGNVASPLQSDWRLQTENLLSFTWLMVLCLSCSLQANPMCP